MTRIPVLVSKPVPYWLLCSVSFSPVCCSCLGDRVRGGRSGQWQPQTGGEFLKAGGTPCVCIHIDTFIAWLCGCFSLHERAHFEHEEVTHPPLNNLSEWKGGLCLFADKPLQKDDVIKKCQVYHYKGNSVWVDFNSHWNRKFMEIVHKHSPHCYQ